MEKSKTYLFIFILSLGTISAFSQMEWHDLKSNPWRVEDISFWGIERAISCSGDGNIFLTEDGGNSWQTVYSNGDYYLRSVKFLNENIAFCGSLDSALFISMDKGYTWTNILGRLPQTPYGICGMDAKDGVIHMVGNYSNDAYHISSDDNGLTFKYHDLSHLASQLVDVYFTHPDTGFAVGSKRAFPTTISIYRKAVILETNDGGQTWFQSFSAIDDQEVEVCWKIYPLKNSLYVSVESHKNVNYIQSMDRGKTWARVFPNIPGNRLQGIGFLNDSIGFFGLHRNTPNISWRFFEYRTKKDTAIQIGISDQSHINRVHKISDEMLFAVGSNIWAYYDSTTTSLSMEQESSLELVGLSKVEVSPNPIINSQLNFIVEYTDDLRCVIELYDLNGKRIKVFKEGYLNKGKHYFSYDMSGLAKGTYLIFQDSFHGQSINRFQYH